MNNTILNCALGGLLLAAVTPAVHAQETNAVTLVDGLEGVFGKQDGFRRSGAKGVCAKGVFTGTPAGAALSSISPS